jgi:hypothetical protein
MTQANPEPVDEKAARLLDALAPDPVDRPDARRALNQFQSRISIERREEFTMFGLKMSKKVQRPLAAGLAAVALISLLAIPQVQAFASEFLSIFRVQRFVLVPISQERMDAIKQAVGDGMDFGQHEVIKDGGDPQEVGSLDEAAAGAGFAPLQAAASYGDPAKVEVSSESVTRYRPDVKAIRQVFSNLNLDPEVLPANIDGKAFDVTTPAGISAEYGAPGKGIRFVQMPSPTVNVPDGVDMEKLGEAMLQLLGMTPDQAARMSKSIDWTTTLVVPVPANLSSVREVSVRGVTGLVYQGSNDQPGSDANGKSAEHYAVTLVWQADGYLFAVMAPNANRAQGFATDLH